MSDRQFEREVNDWLEDGSDRTPERAIDSVLLAVRTTPQERDFHVPWRFHAMATNTRTVGIAAAALVVAVAAGGFVLLSNRDAGDVAAQPTVPAATPAATSAPASAEPSAAPSASPAPIDVPAGFAAFTSPVHGYTVVYPADWLATPASSDAGSDEFVSADNEFGVGIGTVPAGADADLTTAAGLTAWAQDLCTQRSLGACDTYAERVETLCLDAGGDTCRAAILVRSVGTNPDDEGEYAFIPSWQGVAPGGEPEAVIVAATGRGDAFPGAASFGGARALLRTMLAPLGVTSDTGAAPSTPTVGGVADWASFTSPVYGYTLGYPADWNVTPAAVAWQRGMTGDSSSDLFVRPDNDLGIAAWQQPAGDGADVASEAGLAAWAKAFCESRSQSGGTGDDCDAFASRAVPMCMNAGGDPCRAALLVPDSGAKPDDDAIFAFIPAGDTVTILATGRGDAFPGSAVHGGTTALLKGFLETVGVTTP